MEPRYKATAPLNMSVQLTLGDWPREPRSSNWEIDSAQEVGDRRATDLAVMLPQFVGVTLSKRSYAPFVPVPGIFHTSVVWIRPSGDYVLQNVTTSTVRRASIRSRSNWFPVVRLESRSDRTQYVSLAETPAAVRYRL